MSKEYVDKKLSGTVAVAILAGLCLIGMIFLLAGKGGDFTSSEKSTIISALGRKYGGTVSYREISAEEADIRAASNSANGKKYTYWCFIAMAPDGNDYCYMYRKYRTNYQGHKKGDITCYLYYNVADKGNTSAYTYG